MKLPGQRRRTRPNQRRGFRVLVWVLGFFWLAQIVGGLVLDYVWVRPRYPMQADMYARLKARRPAPEIVFFGSSRFYGDVNEGVVDAELRRQFGEGAPRVFNAALPAGDPTVFERVLDDMLRAGYRPKLAVVEVDPGTLAGRDNWLYQHALNVLDWRDVPEAAPALVRNHRIIYLVRGRLLPLHVHRYHICKEAAALVMGMSPAVSYLADPPVPSPIDHDPEIPVPTSEMRERMEHAFVDVTNEVKNYRLGGVVTLRLERMLDRCRSAGIKVMLVGVPVSSPSRRGFTPEVNAVFLEYMHQLGERFGCSFTDWRDKVPDGFFVDGHHACTQGSIYFSRHFADVLAPTWRAWEHAGPLAAK